MADLYNLLDGLDEGQEQEEQEEELVEQQEEWEEPEEQDLPPALAEAAKRKLPSGEEAEEEEDYEVGADLADLSDPKESLAGLPYTKLQKLWSQEMHCPELLPFDNELFDTITSALEQAEERLEEVAVEGMTGNANLDNLFSSILSVDVQRAKFLYCDWLKLRLKKIEAYPLHMREKLDRMSDREVRRACCCKCGF